MRTIFVVVSVVLTVVYVALAMKFPLALWSLVVVGPIWFLATVDFFQTRHAIRRNFPLLGRFRYWLEAIRPEINQYFIESNKDGVPFSREQRSVVYQRAKRDLDTLPFGTQMDTYGVGYEWLNHSVVPGHIENQDLRLQVGGKDCKAPYSSSLLNISAMSYGSLSANAVLALNGGAKDGGFAHNTGEGGITPYHLENGGDLIWQIGTGYFGCRTLEGKFDEGAFSERANLPEVKMIELKLSQGAKPGHGGILPGAKVTPEIAEIRGVRVGEDVISPAGHSVFSTPMEMMEFIQKMRDLSGGKPVGFKLALGKRREFMAMCRAMKETGIAPDFIAVDGAEGGTGAAPLEFSNHVGTPGVDGLVFVHNVLKGFDLRKEIRIMTAGKILTAFGAIKRMALGADLIYSARGMMLALGCIQALRCNSNHCPAGVATQDPNLTAGLVVGNKRTRVHSFHRETLESLVHLLEAIGLDSSEGLEAWHIMRRVSPTEVRHYGELFPQLHTGDLLEGRVPDFYKRSFEASSAKSFHSPGQ